MTRPSLLRKNLQINVLGETTPPFAHEVIADKVQITFKGINPISVFAKKRVYFDCYYTLLEPEGLIRILVPINDTLTIIDQHGNKWKLASTFERYTTKDYFHEVLLQYKSLLKSIIASFSFHITIALVFTALFYMAQKSEEIKNFLGLKSGGVKAIQASYQISHGFKAAEPFTGMSLMKYINSLEDLKKPSEKMGRAAAVLGKFSGMFKSGAIKGGQSSGSGVGAGGIGLNSEAPKLNTKDLISESLNDARNSDLEKSKIKSKKPALIPQTTPQYDRKELLIRNTLETLRPVFSHHFDEALKLDPGLNVSLVYDGVIDSSGKLVKLKLNFKGQGASSATEYLKKQITQSFEQLKFSTECAGIPIHGENIFIK